MVSTLPRPLRSGGQSHPGCHRMSRAWRSVNIGQGVRGGGCDAPVRHTGRDGEGQARCHGFPRRCRRLPQHQRGLPHTAQPYHVTPICTVYCARAKKKDSDSFCFDARIQWPGRKETAAWQRAIHPTLSGLFQGRNRRKGQSALGPRWRTRARWPRPRWCRRCC